MVRQWSRAYRKSSGQSVVEFALVSLIFMLLIFGTIDLGRAVFIRTMFTNAVREGARYGMVNAAQAANANTFQAGIASAAAARSPNLGLGTANFPLTGIRCASASTGSSSFSTTYCATGPSGGSGYPTTPDTLQVCGTYTFTLVAARLIPIGPITMTECAQVIFQ
ncbi:MAG: TadE family protein [Thermomicrobiales bacterium]